MAVSFEQALKQMASQQVSLAEMLSQAHEREVVELQGKLQQLQAAQLPPPSNQGGSDVLQLEEDSSDDDELTDLPTAQTDLVQPALPPPSMPPTMPSSTQEAAPQDCWRRSLFQASPFAQVVLPSGDPPPIFSQPMMSTASTESYGSDGRVDNQLTTSSGSSFMPPPIMMTAASESDDMPNVPIAHANSEDDDDDSDEDDELDDDKFKSELPAANSVLSTGPPANMCRRLSKRHDLSALADKFSGIVASTDPAPEETGTPEGTTNKRRVSIVAPSANTTEPQSPQQGIARAVTTLETKKTDKPWPVWLEVLAALGEEVVEIKPQNEHAQTMKAMTLRRSHLHLSDGSMSLCATVLKKFVMHPSSEKRLFWALSGFVFIMYDVMMIPLSTFDLQIDEFEAILAWFIAIYWTTNWVASMFMGYHERFTVVLRFQKTFLRYAKTWMAPDLCLVLIDWIIISSPKSESGRSEASSARAVKSFYIMRVFRLLRLVRVARLPGSLREATLFLMRSEYTSLSVGIIKHLAFIMLINHLIACLWYTLGNNSEPSWVAFYLEEGTTWQMAYFTSLHWSLTQFTPASMEVVPQNLGERVFAVSVLLFAMVSFSSFVSSITNLMNHLRSLKSVETKQFAKLERYLHDNGISFALSCRVKRYLDHWMAEAKRRPQEKDVEMLLKLSDPLRMEIHYESFRPILVKHPFFAHYEELNGKAMRKLCHTALKSHHLSTGDDLFHTGETAKAMHFVKAGELAYRRPFGRMTDKLEEGDWICEMVLWKPWEHAGTVTAVTECSLMSLDATVFHMVVKETQTASKVAEEDMIAYAFKAAEILSQVPQKDLTDLDDTEIYEAISIAHEAFGANKHLVSSETDEFTSGGHTGWMGHLLDKFSHTASDGVTGSPRLSQRDSSRKSNRESGRTSVTNSRGSGGGLLDGFSSKNSRRVSEVEQAVSSSSSQGKSSLLPNEAVRDRNSRLKPVPVASASPRSSSGGLSMFKKAGSNVSSNDRQSSK